MFRSSIVRHTFRSFDTRAGNSVGDPLGSRGAKPFSSTCDMPIVLADTRADNSAGIRWAFAAPSRFLDSAATSFVLSDARAGNSVGDPLGSRGANPFARRVTCLSFSQIPAPATWPRIPWARAV
jgi:hypothetical protein